MYSTIKFKYSFFFKKSQSSLKFADYSFPCNPNKITNRSVIFCDNEITRDKNNTKISCIIIVKIILKILAKIITDWNTLLIFNCKNFNILRPPTLFLFFPFLIF